VTDNVDDGFGLYVHWPFCLSKCPYCDFNSHVSGAVDNDRWRRALLHELESLATRVTSRHLKSVFFGGGTPSLMDPDTTAVIIEAARNIWPNNAEPEITLEANPTSAETFRLRSFRAAGVNRLSLGIQALNDEDLAFLGRTHMAREALGALDIAKSCFERVSFDLIYARPRQSLVSWEAELRQAIALTSEHLSVYQLTIEPGTQFHARHGRGEIPLPDEDLGGAMFELTRALLAGAGLPAYEISNHARPGAECQHNLVYWRSQDYLGIGPGAHSRITRQNGHRYSLRAHRAPSIWLDHVEKYGQGVIEEASLSRWESVVEFLMMGLRLTEGVSRSRLEFIAEESLEDMFNANDLAALIDQGYIRVDRTVIQATESGLQRLDGVLAMLLARPQLRPAL